MMKNKRKFTLPAIIVGLAVWLITSIALYWVFTQVSSQFPLPSEPIETLPNGVRLQPPTSSSPKLEPDKEKPIIESTLIDNNNREKYPKKQKDKEEDKKPEDKKEEDKKEEDLANNSEPNLAAKPEEPQKKSEYNQDHQPPKNIFEPEIVSTPVLKSPEPQNQLAGSWGAVNEKIIAIETTISKTVDAVKNEIPKEISGLENQNEYLENQKWSTVGDQLIKIEEQMNKSVTELYEMKDKKTD